MLGALGAPGRRSAVGARRGVLGRVELDELPAPRSGERP